MHSRLLLLTVALAAFPACKTVEPAEDVVEQYTDELQIEDLVKGTGEAAVRGSVVTVHYTGWLTDGRTFDSSIGKDPLSFELGARKVIKGWDQGLLGMKVGGKRKLTIPARMAYGDRESGPIPAGSRLIFEVQLLHVAN